MSNKHVSCPPAAYLVKYKHNDNNNDNENDNHMITTTTTTTNNNNNNNSSNNNAFAVDVPGRAAEGRGAHELPDAPAAHAGPRDRSHAHLVHLAGPPASEGDAAVVRVVQRRPPDA